MIQTLHSSLCYKCVRNWLKSLSTQIKPTKMIIRNFRGCTKIQRKHAANHSDTKGKSKSFDNSTPVAVLRDPQKAQRGMYYNESFGAVELAAGSFPTNGLGAGTKTVSRLKLDNIVYAKNLNRTLVLVRNLCGAESTMMFTGMASNMFSTTKLTLNAESTIDVMPWSEATGMYINWRLWELFLTKRWKSSHVMTAMFGTRPSLTLM